MRYLLLALIIFSANIGKAQEFTYNLYGGANYTHLRIIKTDYKNYKYSGNIGWQAGAGTEFHPALFNYFLYLNVGAKHLSYDRDTLQTADSVNSYGLRPLFLDIPFGIGFNFPMSDKYTFKIFGGINTLIGLGGKLKTWEFYYPNPNIDPNNPNNGKLQKKLKEETSLNYGDRNRKGYIFNYATTNWSFQLGTGIDLNRKAEIAVVYNAGLTNILPGKDLTNEIQKTGILEVNLKIDFPNDYLNKGNSKK